MASEAEIEAAALTSLITDTSAEVLGLGQETVDAGKSVLLERLHTFLKTATGNPRRLVVDSMLETHIAGLHSPSDQGTAADSIVQHCAQILQRGVRCWQSRSPAITAAENPIVCVVVQEKLQPAVFMNE